MYSIRMQFYFRCDFRRWVFFTNECGWNKLNAASSRWPRLSAKRPTTATATTTAATTTTSATTTTTRHVRSTAGATSGQSRQFSNGANIHANVTTTVSQHFDNLKCLRFTLSLNSSIQDQNNYLKLHSNCRCSFLSFFQTFFLDVGIHSFCWYISTISHKMVGTGQIRQKNSRAILWR